MKGEGGEEEVMGSYQYVKVLFESKEPFAMLPLLSI